MTIEKYVQVLDDGNDLHERFSVEIDALSRAVAIHDQKLQIVVIANRLGAYKIVPSGVTIVTCALEAAILFDTNMVCLISSVAQIIIFFHCKFIGSGAV